MYGTAVNDIHPVLTRRERLQNLADENAKLRELVRDLYEMAYPECPSAFEAAFADRMRDLGLEVDDG